MPIYEYQCQSCGNEVEVLQKMSDNPLKDCSACGKPDMKKKVSSAAFRLTGSGWYETDFKSKNNKSQSNDKGDSKAKSSDTPSKSQKSASSCCSGGACAGGSSNV